MIGCILVVYYCRHRQKPLGNIVDVVPPGEVYIGRFDKPVKALEGCLMQPLEVTLMPNDTFVISWENFTDRDCNVYILEENFSKKE